MTTDAVQTTNLIKTYNGLTAVNGINLTIHQGELFGFLGPNGAGKTTTLSMLCTILKPTNGTATVWGHDITKNPDTVRKNIGIVFQDPSLDDQLTGRENLRFHARLYKVPHDDIDRRINDILTIVELSDRADDLVKTYSGGMRRRLEIARGLLHHPNVLFLDEPTLGLDPQTRQHIWTYIERLNKEQHITILLTTHYMDEADHLCHRIAIIDHGQIVAQDTPTRLKESLGGDIITLTATPITDQLLTSLRQIPNVKNITQTDGTLQLTVTDSKKTIPLLFETTARCNCTVNTISLREPTLDDVFMKYTGHELREEKNPGKSYMMRQRMRRRMHR